VPPVKSSQVHGIKVFVTVVPHFERPVEERLLERDERLLNSLQQQVSKDALGGQVPADLRTLPLVVYVYLDVSLVSNLTRLLNDHSNRLNTRGTDEHHVKRL
jgi:hypothetical protein